MEQVQNSYDKLELPYIVIQGAVDKLADPFAPIDLENKSPSKDKTTIIAKEMWHTITG